MATPTTFGHIHFYESPLTVKQGQENLIQHVHKWTGNSSLWSSPKWQKRIHQLHHRLVEAIEAQNRKLEATENALISHERPTRGSLAGLSAIGSVMSLGLGIFNQVEISKLYSTMADLKNHENLMVTTLKNHLKTVDKNFKTINVKYHSLLTQCQKRGRQRCLKIYMLQQMPHSNRLITRLRHGQGVLSVLFVVSLILGLLPWVFSRKHWLRYPSWRTYPI
jgi:hypothetical protein